MGNKQHLDFKNVHDFIDFSVLVRWKKCSRKESMSLGLGGAIPKELTVMSVPLLN